MTEVTLAKVILFTDASVHICVPTPQLRTFYATVNDLVSLMSSPLDYLADAYERAYESTQDLFGENVTQHPPYEKCPGLVLCYISANKEFVCRFPEILNIVFNAIDENQRNERLNMRSFLDGSLSLSDAKTFILKYYLSFVNSFERGTTIKNELHLSEETFYSILREIFNTAFTFKPLEQPYKDLEARYREAEYRQFLETPTPNELDNMVTITEYCAIHKVPNRTIVRQMIKDGLIEHKMVDKKYYVNKRQKPVMKEDSQPKSVSARIAPNDTSEYLFTNSKNWPAAKVKDYIIKNNFFSSAVAEYIYSLEELDLYRNESNPFFEVEWLNQRFLIMRFDLDVVDKDGKTNRERMKAGYPPMVVSPDNKSEMQPTMLHHLGQDDKVHVGICPFMHKKYSSVLHASEPDRELHDGYFALLKIQFWQKYVAELEKANNCFDAIPHVYPRNKLRE